MRNALYGSIDASTDASAAGSEAGEAATGSACSTEMLTMSSLLAALAAETTRAVVLLSAVMMLLLLLLLARCVRSCARVRSARATAQRGAAADGRTRWGLSARESIIRETV